MYKLFQRLFNIHPSYSFRYGALAGVCLLGIAGLSGCTATGGNKSTQDSIMTTFDMTEGRKRAIIRLQLAAGYFERNQLEIALDEVKRAIAADPRYSTAYNMRGLIYAQLGDKATAEANFRRALGLNSTDGDAQHNLGYVLCEQGRYDEARGFFAAALENPLYRNKQKTHRAQAQCESRSGNTGTAESQLLKVYEAGQRTPMTANALAEVYYKKRDYRRAALYARQANANNAGNAATLWLAIKIEHKLKNPAAVNRYVRLLREYHPNSKELQMLKRGEWND